jgi:hypothetical protein
MAGAGINSVLPAWLKLRSHNSEGTLKKIGTEEKKSGDLPEKNDTMQNI